MRKWTATLLAFGLGAGLLVSACSAPAAKLAAGERTIYLAAIEPKGTTNVSKEPFPAQALPEGGGYGLDEPDADGNWVVETYRWLPGEITVAQGDRVTLEILGVNGDSHPSAIEGYDLTFEVKRGQLTTVAFVADKPGIFKIFCSVHQPSMTGQLVVLPSS